MLVILGPSFALKSDFLSIEATCLLILGALLSHSTFCKVVRIGKCVQPDISKARQQVNIDRPAYNKTDKQCRTRTTITARLPDD